MSRVLMPLADGFEEIESMVVIDILRRADIETIIVGLPASIIEGAHGIKIIADKKFDNIELDSFDAIVLPGGDKGVANLGKSNSVMNAIESFEEKGKLVAAICAAPKLLAKAGIMKDRRGTIYPGLERELPRPRNDAVIEDENVITSQGPGTSIEFALKIVEKLSGKTSADTVKHDILA